MSPCKQNNTTFWKFTNIHNSGIARNQQRGGMVLEGGALDVHVPVMPLGPYGHLHTKEGHI